MAEQLALEQRLGKRGTVDRHKRIVPATAPVVDRLADHLFPGPVLAQQQDRQIRVRNPADLGTERLDGRALPQQLHPLRGAIRHLIADLDQLLTLLSILQGNRCMTGQLRQRRLVIRREIAPHAVDQLERAEQLAAPPPQRHAQQRPRAKTQLPIDPPVDRGLVVPLVDAQRLPRVHDPSHHALVVRNPQLASGHAERGRPTSVRFGRSQRKILARSACIRRVDASAIASSSRSISCVRFHWPAIARMASRRARRRPRSHRSRTTSTAARTSRAAPINASSKPACGPLPCTTSSSLCEERGSRDKARQGPRAP